MLEEDAEVWVSLGVDGGLKHWKEDILQHLSEVWQEILGSEHITKGKREGDLGESIVGRLCRSRRTECHVPEKDLVCSSYTNSQVFSMHTHEEELGLNWAWDWTLYHILQLFYKLCGKKPQPLQ